MSTLWSLKDGGHVAYHDQKALWTRGGRNSPRAIGEGCIALNESLSRELLSDNSRSLSISRHLALHQRNDDHQQ
jgi:hypothetical protein